MPDADLERAVRRLIDEADVAQVVLRYADAIDRREFERVTPLFAPDGFVRGTSFEGPVAEYLPQLYEGVRGFGATQHFMGNQLRRVDGDRGTHRELLRGEPLRRRGRRPRDAHHRGAIRRRARTSR